MPISYPKPPTEVRNALSSAERSRSSDRADSAASDMEFRSLPLPLGVEGLGQTQDQEAHEVFLLTPDVVRAGQEIGAAQPAGWRFLTPEVARPLGGVAALASRTILEVAKVDGTQKLVRRQEGWMGAATKRTMDLVAALPEVAADQYEFRMLRLPGVARTDGIWLKNQGAGEDLVVPISSASPDVVAGRVYTSAEFMQLMRVEAAKPGFDNSPRP